jgi:hypothetical protein
MPRDGEIASLDSSIEPPFDEPPPHAAVIGRHTLPFLLMLMSHGCGCVRSLRPGAAAPDCEAADLVWIVDVADARELDDALRSAHRRTGDTGRIVLEDAACRPCLATLADHADAAGLALDSVDPATRRVVLVARRLPAKQA